jgi:tRNA A37 threonylcarbamoyladenosine dehydratase
MIYLLNVHLKPGLKRYTEESANDFDVGSYDIVIRCQCISLSKIHLLIQAYEAGCTVYSSMGAAWKSGTLLKLRWQVFGKRKDVPLVS